MSFYLAFDKEKNKELLVYSLGIKKQNNIIVRSSYESHVEKIGTFLLKFLNTDFRNINASSSFIAEYCFKQFYDKKYPKEKINAAEFLKTVSKYELSELISISKQEQANFMFIQNVFFRSLNLSYDTKIDKYDEYFKAKELDINDSQIDDLLNELISDISLVFDYYIFEETDLDIASYNIPYLFCSSDILSILGIMVKEFISNKKSVIKRCENCGIYFIPENLHVTKYCNNIYKDNKTCKQIGKNITYSNSLKKDVLLEKYRKRYMSLASIVSHYGTEKSIIRFENYKLEGNIIKQKYLNHEISKSEFEKWIDNSKTNYNK